MTVATIGITIVVVSTLAACCTPRCIIISVASDVHPTRSTFMLSSVRILPCPCCTQASESESSSSRLLEPRLEEGIVVESRILVASADASISSYVVIYGPVPFSEDNPYASGPMPYFARGLPSSGLAENIGVVDVHVCCMHTYVYI